MTALVPVELTGEIVRLEPLSHDHAAGLVEATKDGELWKLWYTSVPTPDGMEAEIDRRLVLQDAGTMIPFATRDLRSGKVIGMTTYMNIDASLPRVEIGSTWNAKSAQGSGINPESKLLLLTHAFEVWDCPAVEFRTSWHNRQSRAAIEKLGAKLDGVLRQHTRTSDGSLRDTCVYSVVQAEWPQVRASLRFRLGREV
ncbi:GNAT family N-acetyltransferase [Corynebacterium variabile]|uniref:GNAT family N-acetyltransferase n=1 Tax=Corynebacterium variabile TaxID=1727 RepID=UPI001DF4A0CB|nr:GNAT family protein [Corynebacterium variabile]HJG46004.1 GNAT family N-acetyltransferase [Corynebacterium variabile]